MVEKAKTREEISAKEESVHPVIKVRNPSCDRPERQIHKAYLLFIRQTRLYASVESVRASLSRRHRVRAAIRESRA